MSNQFLGAHAAELHLDRWMLATGQLGIFARRQWPVLFQHLKGFSLELRTPDLGSFTQQ